MSAADRSRRKWGEDHLLPREFVDESRRRSRREFLEEYGDTRLLLVQLDGSATELLSGLLSASTVSGERLKPTKDAIGFATVLEDPGEPNPAHADRALASGPRLDTVVLETRLVRMRYFVAPLRKRRVHGEAFAHRISVGRARNTDIVLRHPSVSKYHAWFECDDVGDFYVVDAKSKNGTKVAGARIRNPDARRVEPGEEIRFGKVATTICPPDTFYDVVSG